MAAMMAGFPPCPSTMKGTPMPPVTTANAAKGIAETDCEHRHADAVRCNRHGRVVHRKGALHKGRHDGADSCAGKQTALSPAKA